MIQQDEVKISRHWENIRAPNFHQPAG
jgi:hypothetical protein